MTVRHGLILLLVTLVLPACDRGGGQGAPGGAPPPPEVELAPVRRASVPLRLEAPGRLQAVRTAEVRARVDGIVARRLFVEGSDVAEATPLYQLDARPQEAAVKSAEAAVAKARAEAVLARQTLNRQRTLLGRKAASEQELDQAEAQLKITEAQLLAGEAALTRARLDLEYTAIAAPIAGRVGRTRVTEGALVGKGEATHLTTIEQIDPIWVNFTQGSADFLRLRRAIQTGEARAVAQVEVRLILEDGGDYPQPGRLLFTDQGVDPETGSVAMRAEFPNPDKGLLPGQFVRARLVLAQAEGVLTVPQRAVQSSPQGQIVLMVDPENKVVPRPIRTGGFSGQDWVVREGLKEGELVIVNGVQKARPGTVVAPKTANGS